MAAATSQSISIQFTQYFAAEFTNLQDQLSGLSSKSTAEQGPAISTILAGISRLSKEVSDASEHLPAYDQRQCAEQVKTLSEKFQATKEDLKPRTKFKFRGKVKSKAPVREEGLGTSATKDEASGDKTKAGGGEEIISEFLVDINQKIRAAGKDNEISGLSFTDASQVMIYDQANVRIQLPVSSAPPRSSSVIRSISSSVIDLSKASPPSNPLAGLILRDISNSIIICGVVSGPIHITNMKNSKLVVVCQQFRMHESKDVDIYLHCGSKPIVEDVEQVRFAPISDQFVSKTALLGYKSNSSSLMRHSRQ
jgi:hypothetical protein